jgi:hypothetical protein
MEHARKLAWGEAGDDRRSSRSSDDSREARDSIAHLDRLLRVAMAPEERGPERGGERTVDLPRGGRVGLTEYDFAAAVDLVGQAAQAMRDTQERTEEMEARSKSLLDRVTEQLNAAEARVKSAETRARIAEAREKEAEQRIKEAEAREREAEGRAKKAEEWLTRIHDSVIDMLSRNGIEAA